MRLPTATVCLLILAGVKTRTFAQALVEHAAVALPAAAGSSTGAAIGSSLSATLDNAAGTAQKAATPVRRSADRAQSSARTRAAESANSLETSPGPKIVWRRGMEHRTQLIHSGTAEPSAANLPAVAQSTASVSSNDIAARLAAVAPGMTRQEVVSRLGAPSYTIAMAGDDGRQIERMRFRAMGEDIATVEVRDGVVSSVTKRAP